MSSTNPAPSPDTPITIKIALNNGENRRFKLPLRECGANTLPEKLRALLAVPANQTVTFERFSDSASSYIKLDSNNPAVYKQLYRAAKAKLKLRIRAVISTDLPSVGKVAPPVVPMPEHHLTSHCYVPPMNPDPLRVNGLENFLRASAKNPSSPQIKLEADVHNLPYASGRDSASVPFSTSKETLAQSLGLGTPKAEIKKEADGEAPVPRYFSPKENFYAELASLSSKDSKATLRNATQPWSAPVTATSFTICCNQCDATISNAHHHCSKCDNGDFDLCENCYNRNVRCKGDDHWMVKRYVEDGKVTSSSTETAAPKKSTTALFDLDTNLQACEIKTEIPGAFTQEIKEAFQQPMDMSRTCNSCIGQFDEFNFVTCTVCEDYDLCIACHVQNRHGHHPSHAFMPASEEVTLNSLASRLLAPGRNTRHAALCDGCDKDVVGVRHKCMTCPDWDYCSTCVKSADREHPGHRFVPLYESISNPMARGYRHCGIHCDGPLCVTKTSYILGDRYKCAVCHDTDFCANCEALPTKHHNPTHPLIKFKTPVKNVSVTTLGEKENGEHSYTVGDRLPQTSSKSTETNPAAPSANAATQVQTVAEVAPTEPPKEEVKPQQVPAGSELQAKFERDTVTDGSVLAPGKQFEQIWTLSNPGPHAWPVGCSVRFVGGDTMFNVDPNHPSNVTDVMKATESNSTDRVVEVGESIDFKVVMRTPEREGKAISYWRLKSPDGYPFGHKLWCDISVRAESVVKSYQAPEQVDESVEKVEPAVSKPVEEVVEKSMIFPKLESPFSSAHEEMSTKRVTVPDAEYPGHETDTVSNTADNGRGEEEMSLADEVEDLALDDSETDDGFLTDEEYEMLTASEDEFKEANNGKK